MTDEKMIPTDALASLTSGILMSERFGPVHAAIEHIMGHPVWTHQIPAYADRVKSIILERYPDLPVRAEGEEWPEAMWIAEREAARARYGMELAMPRGREPDEGPMAHLPEGVPIITI